MTVSTGLPSSNTLAIAFGIVRAGALDPLGERLDHAIAE